MGQIASSDEDELSNNIDFIFILEMFFHMNHYNISRLDS